MSEIDLVQRLRNSDIGWSGDACCVDADTAAKGAAMIESLRTQLASARKALEKHGSHLGGCDVFEKLGRICTCGFENALKDTPK